MPHLLLATTPPIHSTNSMPGKATTHRIGVVDMQTCSQGPGPELQPGHHLAKLSRWKGGWVFLFWRTRRRGGGIPNCFALQAVQGAKDVPGSFVPQPSNQPTPRPVALLSTIFISFFGSFFNCSPQMLSIFILLFPGKEKKKKKQEARPLFSFALPQYFSSRFHIIYQARRQICHSESVNFCFINIIRGQLATPPHIVGRELGQGGDFHLQRFDEPTDAPPTAESICTAHILGSTYPHVLVGVGRFPAVGVSFGRLTCRWQLSPFQPQ